MNEKDVVSRLESYGIDAEKTSRLDGYESENFLIDSGDSRFVFKHYPSNSIRKDEIEAENEVLARLSEIQPGTSPAPVELSGALVAGNQASGFDRLLTFVEGEFLADTNVDRDLRYSFGEFMARLSRDLNIDVPLAYRAREISWDLRHFELCYPKLSYIEDARKRSMVEYFFGQVRDRVRGLELRMGLIHGDAHESNVLCRSGEVTGIIDFGDASYTHLINEVAIACSYLMFEQDDPIDAAADFVRGYCSVSEITEDGDSSSFLSDRITNVCQCLPFRGSENEATR